MQNHRHQLVETSNRSTRQLPGNPLPRARMGLATRTAALTLGLLLGCAGNQTKHVAANGEGGEGGDTAASAGAVGAGIDDGNGGVGAGGGIVQGNAGAGLEPGEGGAGGSASGGGGSEADADAGAAGADAGAAGADAGPSIPVSVCGPGKWFVGEGLCGDCPPAPQVFEMDCDDYASAQVLTGSTGQLQFAFASLPDGVQGREALPVELSVTYLDPNESHARLLRLNASQWSVDLRQAPDPPATLIVPPFSTADVCGDVFHSREPMRFERVGDSSSTSYTKVCP